MPGWSISIDDGDFKPTSRDEWTPELAKVKAELGITDLSSRYSCEVSSVGFTQKPRVDVPTSIRIQGTAIAFNIAVIVIRPNPCDFR